MSVVYWIHLPEHTDMFTQGYIGVSRHTAKSRFNQHVNKAKHGGKLKIHMAIRKYSDIVLTTVLEGSSEYCYMVEDKLRPVAETGWNLSIGGKIPHGFLHTEEVKSAQRERRLGKKASAETKMKKSLQNRGEGNPFYGKTHSDSAKKKLSESRQYLKDTPWLHPRAIIEMWVYAQEVYIIYSANPSITSYSIPKILPITINVAQTILTKIKTGWIPNEDLKWLLLKTNEGQNV